MPKAGFNIGKGTAASMSLDNPINALINAIGTAWKNGTGNVLVAVGIK